jgi:hypothetical protein
MNREVEVKIERLLLHGFPLAARERIAAAFAAELQRLYAGAPVTSFAARRVNAGAIRSGAGGAPDTVGAQAARQLFAHLHGTSNRGGRP